MNKLAQPIAGVILIVCALWVLWRDRTRKTIDHEPAPSPAPAPAPAPAPRADDPDPARPGAAA